MQRPSPWLTLSLSLSPPSLPHRATIIRPLDVGVCAVLEQQPDHVVLAALGCCVERRGAVRRDAKVDVDVACNERPEDVKK